MELELVELLLDIMATMHVDTVCFCFNDTLNLFDYQRVKTDRTALRKVVQDCWSSTKSLCSAKKLRPAPNSLSYTTYQMGVFLNEPAYVESKKVGRYHTVTRQMLENL